MFFFLFNILILIVFGSITGTPHELLSADCNAGDRLPSGRHSIKGLGQTAPPDDDSSGAGAGATRLSDGTRVLLGPAGQTTVRPGDGGAFTLAYNEYVVYDPAQVRMRYLARIKFHFNR